MSSSFNVNRCLENKAPLGVDGRPICSIGRSIQAVNTKSLPWDSDRTNCNVIQHIVMHKTDPSHPISTVPIREESVNMLQRYLNDVEQLRQYTTGEMMVHFGYHDPWWTKIFHEPTEDLDSPDDRRREVQLDLRDHERGAWWRDAYTTILYRTLTYRPDPLDDGGDTSPYLCLFMAARWEEATMLSTKLRTDGETTRKLKDVDLKVYEENVLVQAQTRIKKGKQTKSKVYRAFHAVTFPFRWLRKKVRPCIYDGRHTNGHYATLWHFEKLN